MKQAREIVIVGSDDGGTMTDMIMVDADGEFVLGKASTTPEDESIGFINALADAFDTWGMDWEKPAGGVLPDVQCVVYSGTAMLNALLTRRGRKVGLIVTKGFEETLLHERGAGIHAGYGYQDKMHKVAHVHNVPFVPKRLIRGVTERLSIALGAEVIPVYDEEARQAAADLLDRGVEAIAILCLHSYLNPAHERRIAEIAREVMRKREMEVPLYLSSELMPVWRECSRLNATLLQAYGAEQVRGHLHRIETKLADKGYRFPLQIVLADGGIANIRYPALFKACFSGPIGGLLGGRYLAKTMDMANLVCTDMGGTSFDVGLIMGGEPVLAREVEVGRSMVNIPSLVMSSIGAGTGQYVCIDPEAGRLEIGPESAGAAPGPVAYNTGNETPTVTDCLLALGILNAEYYLGGKVKLHKDLALAAIRKTCADPLGVDLYDFAEGIIRLINTRMREHIGTVLSVWGYSPADYYVIGYGGAGPTFLAGYTEGLPFKGVFTVPWAAGFSAFGCCAGDYVHRYQKSIPVLAVLPDADESTKAFMGAMINAAWEDLETIALREMRDEGFSAEDIVFNHIAYVRYLMQLEDVEVVSPVPRIHTSQHMDTLLRAFEETYAQKYTHSAKHSDVGYQIMEVGLHALVRKPKPLLRKYPLHASQPLANALKGRRGVYQGGEWKDAAVYELELLESGNEVKGLAILEAPTTTLFVPAGKLVEVDEYKRYWLRDA